MDANERDVLLAMQLLNAEANPIIANCASGVKMLVDEGVGETYWDEVRAEARRRLNSVSVLSPARTNHTSLELKWISEKIIKSMIDFVGEGRLITASVWPYREQGFQMLSCDLGAEVGGEYLRMPIVITASGENDFSVIDEPDVVDMAEAFHLARLIVVGLGATIEF